MILLKSGLIVPCGKCPACLANNRQELVFRLKQEYKSSSFALFVTLTYDDDHLPAGGSVCKDDVIKFHKRLRKHFPSGQLRYFLCSEYGDHTFRPHYHGLYFFKDAQNQDRVYQIFLESWQKGFVKFGEVEEGSIVYCTKYCLKLTSTPPGKALTFRLFSKMNGGLGTGYLDKMSDYHISNNQFNFVASDGQKCRMPRYYRRKISPYEGSSKFNPLHYRIESDRLQDIYEYKRKRFADFCKRYGSGNLQLDQQHFQTHEDRIRESRDGLLTKHCKKQKF